MATLETLNLNADKLNDVFSGWREKRAYMERRKQYYRGDHAITYRREQYADGREKTNLVTNWVKIILDRYRGAISPFQITTTVKAIEGQVATEDVAEERTISVERNPAWNEYYALHRNQFLSKKDREILSDVLLYGYAVEVHGYDSERGIKVENYDPVEWAFMRDEQDELKVAIRQREFKKGQIYRGSVLQNDIVVMDVYTDTHHCKWQKDLGGDVDSWDLIEGFPRKHYYNNVPVIQWRFNEVFRSVISDAIIEQNDEYNRIDSGRGDDALAQVDCLLKIWGFDAEFIKKNQEIINRWRILPLSQKDEQDAAYMSRDPNLEVFSKRLTSTRDHIHEMAGIPDVLQIIGSTGATSGIALQLMFLPMENICHDGFLFLEEGVRKRIQLINTVWKKEQKPVLDDFEVTIQFKRPVNRKEEWDSVQNLRGIVSHRTMLRLLTDISNPEEELTQLEIEGRAEDEGKSPEAVEKRDRLITEQADATATAIEKPLMDFSNKLTDAFKGAIGKATKDIEKQKKQGETEG